MRVDRSKNKRNREITRLVGPVFSINFFNLKKKIYLSFVFEDGTYNRYHISMCSKMLQTQNSFKLLKTN
ncbi:hypothetical protein HanIR_Chr12g0563211 [Helianthus annuus]|nr:hypothetical protein HanIR_Chr12g0563211 [Helianthus annuus]